MWLDNAPESECDLTFKFAVGPTGLLLVVVVVLLLLLLVVVVPA